MRGCERVGWMWGCFGGMSVRTDKVTYISVSVCARDRTGGGRGSGAHRTCGVGCAASVLTDIVLQYGG